MNGYNQLIRQCQRHHVVLASLIIYIACSSPQSSINNNTINFDFDVKNTVTFTLQTKIVAMAPAEPEDASATTESKCHLLELPPELRNEMYKLALTSDEPVEVTAYTKEEEGLIMGHFHRTSTSFHHRPAPLLQTSHQIRSEATPIYYGVNTFAFPVCEVELLLAHAHTVHLGPLAKYAPLVKRFQVKSWKRLCAVDLSAHALTGNIVVTYLAARGPHTCMEAARLCAECIFQIYDDLRTGEAQTYIDKARTSRGVQGGLGEEELKGVLKWLG